MVQRSTGASFAELQRLRQATTLKRDFELDAFETTAPSFMTTDASHRGRMFRHLTRWRISAGVQLLDVAVVIGAALLLYPISQGYPHLLSLHYIIGSSAIALFCHFLFAQGHLYQIDALLDETRAIKSILVRWSLLFLGFAAASTLVREPDLFSRTWFMCFYIGGGAALAGERSFVALQIRQWIRRGYITQSIVIVGQNDLAEALISRLDKNSSGIRVVGQFDDRADRASALPAETTGRNLRGVPALGDIDDLLEYSKHNTVDLVILTMPISATDRMNYVIGRLRHQPLAIRVLPGMIGLDRVSPMRLSRNELPGVQLIAVADRPMSDFALFIKGAIDRCSAAVALLVLLPVFLAIGCGIAMSSPGPIFFRQLRIGYRGRMFWIYKFRTMNVSAQPNVLLTQRNDKRVFPFGAVLRKLSLDELPQLINVLNGDMSLVGPRPHMPQARAAGKLYFEAVNEYAGRHRVKPGITGWAQINGWRGPTETLEQIERRVEHDIYYIENWSVMFDIVILLRTVLVGFMGKNAF
jgi:Undecaprenyl-phosphate glucose phosphotransferase